MAEISRDPADLVRQTCGAHHQYPDGFFLFLGYVTQTWGLESTTPSRSAFLTSLFVVFVALSCQASRTYSPGGTPRIEKFPEASACPYQGVSTTTT